METRGELPEKIGKYEILGTIGRGGMGVVYKALDPVIDRIVAVKTIHIGADCDDDQLGRLRMEARSAGRLQHPNIVTVYDFGEQGDLSYIVMEYVQGINLSRAVAKRKPVPLPIKLDILAQVARGLAYAHEAGVVHRDLKPSNICVTARGVAKILDFGLARFDNTRLTKTGYLSGTIAYMSPERFSGESGPQDDIFALGAVAYEFLAYERAFPGQSTPEVISKILGGPMPRPISEQTGYPRELDLIILRALDRDPVQRFPTAAAFAQALEHFVRTDEYQDFVADDTLSPQAQAVDWSDDSVHASLSPYSSAGSLDSLPPGDAPTLRVGSDHAVPSRTEVEVPAGEPTVATTRADAARNRDTASAIDPRSMGSPATESVRAPDPSRKNLIPALVAAALLSVMGWVYLARGPVPPPIAGSGPIRKTQSSDETAPTDPARVRTEVLLATARTLADVVERRALTADEKRRFSEASGQMERARALMAARNYAGGEILAQEAAESMRKLVQARAPFPGDAKGSRSAAGPATPPGERSKKKTDPVTQSSGAPAAEDVSKSRASPSSGTQPEAGPPVVPPPSRAEMEREIRTFMRSVASAYQDKDVTFFREHSLRYSEHLADAIRNSPSKRVEITVQSIQFLDDQTAKVVAKRTDSFAEAGLPPGVQMLSFELQRVAEAWKIASFSRR